MYRKFTSTTSLAALSNEGGGSQALAGAAQPADDESRTREAALTSKIMPAALILHKGRQGKAFARARRQASHVGEQTGKDPKSTAQSGLESGVFED